MQFSKVLFVSFLGFGAVWLINDLLELLHIQLGSTSTIAVYLLISLIFLYLPVPKRRLFTRKAQPVEYLVNGQGQVTKKIFSAAEFSDYVEIERTSHGRILADSVGKIICTQFAASEENENGQSRLHLIFLCLISTGFSLMYQNLWPLFQSEQVESMLSGWAENALWRNPDLYVTHLGNNIQRIADAASAIRPEINLGKCLEIIKENLERLSILQFT